MNNKLLSVIIPAYNCEKYIEKCLDSLTTQVADNGEIVVINDGSTDKTGEIIERIASENDCIVYLSRQNGGVSSARNAGLSAAQGKYIMFCDADDWYEDGAVAYLIDMMEKNDADIGRYGTLYSWNTKKQPSPVPIEPGVYNKDSLDKLYLYRMIGPSCNAELNKPTKFIANLWNHIIKRSIISDNSLKFDESLAYSEDQLFIISALIHSKKMVVTDKLFYNYFQSDGSAVRSFNSRSVEDSLRYCSLLEQLTRDCGIYEQTERNRQLNYVRTGLAVAEYIFSATNNLSNKDRLYWAKTLLDRKEFNCVLSELDLNDINTVYRTLYRCLIKKNYSKYMYIKHFRNFIYKIRHHKSLISSK